MNDEKGNNNGNTILLTVIGVATLLVALVGATFAYFSASITNNQQESILLSTATPVGLKYLGATLNLDNIVPGDKTDGTFTVENPATATGQDGTQVANKVQQTYDLDIVIDNNTLTTAYKANNGRVEEAGDAALLADQLRVTITSRISISGTNSKGETVTTELKPIQYNATDHYNLTSMKPENGKIPVVTGQQIAIGEIHEYAIAVELVDLEIPQDDNQGKTFEAHIEIGNTKSVKES